MRVAVLGSTSQIAKDALRSNWLGRSDFTPLLFCRDPERLRRWVAENGLLQPAVIDDYTRVLHHGPVDVIINFVGSGDPRRTASIGSEILEITREFDDLSLSLLDQNKDARYLFLSSGAAYGDAFETAPVADNSHARFRLNELSPGDFYGIAKFAAEARHRTRSEQAIVDLRVFSYASLYLPITGSFLVSQVAQAIVRDTTFRTTTENIVRDYVGPQGFVEIVDTVLKDEPRNVALDCRSTAPVDKLSLLKMAEQDFGLRVEFDEAPQGSGSGGKRFYYSGSTSGLMAPTSSMEVVTEALAGMLLLAREVHSAAQA